MFLVLNQTNPTHILFMISRQSILLFQPLLYTSTSVESLCLSGFPTKKTFYAILGALAKLWKASISFVLPPCLSVCPSVRPSVRMEQFGSQWRDFHENLSIFLKSVEKIQVSSQSDKHNVFFTRRKIYIFYHISPISS